MSEGRSQKTGAATLVVMTFAVAFAVYLAVFPLLFAWWWKRDVVAPSLKGWGWPTAASSGSTAISERWVMHAGKPYFLLAAVPTLGEPLRRYHQWCQERALAGTGAEGGVYFLPR